MRRRQRQAGYTLIEALVAGLIMTLIGAGLWNLIRSSYDSQYIIMGENNVNANARQAIDELADRLRGASAVTAYATADITFTDNNGASVRYWRSGTTLRKTVNGAPSGGSTVASGVQALNFVYWSWNGSAWVSSSAPSDLSKVGAVDFTVTVTINGASRQLSGAVRIRQKRF